MNTNNFHLAIFGNERSIHVRRWVLGLRDMGHLVDLITMHKDSEHDIGGIDLGARSKISYLLNIGKLKQVVKRLQPDIFHTHYASSYGFVASFINHPRKVLSVWGDDIIIFPHRNFITHCMIYRALTNSHQITATSKFLKEVALELNRTIPISVIPFGVDVDLFKCVARIPREQIRIGIAKHLYPQYGIDILIRAFQIVASNHNNVKLIIAGRGNYESEYRKLVDEFGLSNKVDFVGAIEYHQMPKFLESLDIAVMPSTCNAESFGVAALEASATGLPVVGTKVGGIPEVITDEVTGYLAENKNAKEVAKYLMLLIDQRELRNKMGLAGRKMVEEKYSWQSCLFSMQQLYYKMYP